MDKRTTEDILRNHDEINRLAAAMRRESRDYIHMPRATPQDRLMVAAVLDELTKTYALVSPADLEAVESLAAKVPALERDVRHILYLLRLVCCDHDVKKHQMPCYGEACEPCEIGKWIRAHVEGAEPK